MCGSLHCLANTMTRIESTKKGRRAALPVRLPPSSQRNYPFLVRVSGIRAPRCAPHPHPATLCGPRPATPGTQVPPRPAAGPGVFDPRLVAGTVLKLSGWGHFDSEYVIQQATHNLDRDGGYRTSVELVKSLDY